MTGKKELAVAAIQYGTVIDHIPAAALFTAVRILGIEHMTNAVTIGNNLASGKLGAKGIIKVEGKEFDEATLNRIALIAPTAVVNVIRDYTVVEKRPVRLPDELVGLVKCDNPKCITNHEPMRTRFATVRRSPVEIRCCYCNRAVSGNKAHIL